MLPPRESEIWMNKRNIYVIIIISCVGNIFEAA